MKLANNISEMITTAENFQYSINIAYDFSDDKKIENYIATNDAVRIIEDVLLSTKDSSEDRARLFVGAYGKGKSHLALILIALVYKKDKKVFGKILSKIKEINPDLHSYLNTYIASDNKLLPVIVDGNKMSLQQSLLSALKNSLEREGIVGIMPETYFSVAIETISMWKQDYKKTYEEFTSLIDVSTETFINKLKNFERDALNTFEQVFPRLTSGSSFTPILNGDVISLYSDVIKEVSRFGFNGIFLVYDEFSKYLEGNVHTTTAADIKMLQDLAEKANRSGNEQLHLLMISHKSIMNYIDELPKIKVDAWKAVSERFKKIELSNSQIQSYDLITHVIIKDTEKYRKFCEDNHAKFDSMVKSYFNKNIFTGLSRDQLESVFKGCYPLEPTSLYMLPIISEKVAQNERSMFTFLSSKNDKNALFNLLKSDVQSITPDRIFDYFEEQFKNEAYTTNVHKFWKLVITAISLINNSNELEHKLIKSLAMIYILDQIEIVRPTSDNLLAIFSKNGYESYEVIDCIESLKERGVFKYSTRTHYLRLSDRTDINIDEILRNEIVRRKPTFDALSILNGEASKIYFYPNKYNDEKEIVRYFSFEFLTYQQLLEIEDWDKKIEDPFAAGTIFAIYNSKEEMDRSCFKKIDNNRILLAVPKANEDIDEALRQYDALSFLVENSDDELFIEELTIVLDEIEHQIKKYIDGFVNPINFKVDYFHRGEIQDVSRKSQLSNKLSKICNEIFLHTPIIVNEVVNRNRITKQAMNSRNKVVEGLLENDIRKNLGLTGSGQDVSFFRSLIKNTGIYGEENEYYIIRTDNLKGVNSDFDGNMNYVLGCIRKFILSSSEGEQNIGDLYDLLTLAENGIGIKQGIIPFYFAAVLHRYKRFVVIKRKEKEHPLSANLLDSINKNPQQYSIVLESWSKEKEDYINLLEIAFNKFLADGEKEYNTFDYIVKAMQRWFYRLPKYSKEATIYTVNSQTVELKSVEKLRQLLKTPDINARELLFEKLPKAFYASEVDGILGEKIAVAKYELDMQINNLQKDLELTLVEVLKGDSGLAKPLYTIAKDWYGDLSTKTKEHLFKNGEGELLSTIGEVQNDIDDFVRRIGRVLSGLHLDDWNDDTFEVVKNRLEEQVANINNFNISDNETSKNRYMVTLLDGNGNDTVKTFDKIEVSKKGSILQNDIKSSISEFGNALTEGEKRQILMNVMFDHLK